MRIGQPEWKAFISDGSRCLWRAWDRRFEAFGFVPILDFLRRHKRTVRCFPR